MSNIEEYSNVYKTLIIDWTERQSKRLNVGDKSTIVVKNSEDCLSGMAINAFS